MRGSNDSDSANPALRDVRYALDPAPPYTPEQRELLEQGLRILARLIVRTYFQEAASPASQSGISSPIEQEWADWHPPTLADP